MKCLVFYFILTHWQHVPGYGVTSPNHLSAFGRKLCTLHFNYYFEEFICSGLEIFLKPFVEVEVFLYHWYAFIMSLRCNLKYAALMDGMCCMIVLIVTLSSFYDDLCVNKICQKLDWSNKTVLFLWNLSFFFSLCMSYNFCLSLYWCWTWLANLSRLLVHVPSFFPCLSKGQSAGILHWRLEQQFNIFLKWFFSQLARIVSPCDIIGTFLIHYMVLVHGRAPIDSRKDCDSSMIYYTFMFHFFLLTPRIEVSSTPFHYLSSLYKEYLSLSVCCALSFIVPWIPIVF